MAAYAYLRVSTDEQGDTGHGLAAQQDACTRYAGELAGVFTDVVSGKTSLDKRPNLMALLAVLAPGDTLMVAKRDRLGRDPIAVAMIESAVARKGARIASAAGEGTEGDSPTDILMRRMVDAFAEYERLVIGARTKAALAAKKARKERTGSVPYGYRLAADGVHLVPDAQEQEAVRLVKMLRDAGESYRAIATELAKRGYQPRGKSWAPQTIKNITQAEVAA